MQFTLKSLLRECLSEAINKNQSAGADPLKYPSQILCLAANINFTQRAEKAITSNNLSSFLGILKVSLVNRYATLR